MAVNPSRLLYKSNNIRHSLLQRQQQYNKRLSQPCSKDDATAKQNNPPSLRPMLRLGIRTAIRPKLHAPSYPYPGLCGGILKVFLTDPGSEILCSPNRLILLSFRRDNPSIVAIQWSPTGYAQRTCIRQSFCENSNILNCR